MGALAALVLPSFSSSTVKLIAIAAAIFALVAFGAWGQHKIDADALDRLKAQYAQAQAAAASAALAKQQRYDADAVTAAQQDQQKQLALSSDIQRSQQEIIRYVPKTRSCVPVGLVSVLRSAIGVSVNVPAAAGKSDDACSSVGWPDLARGVIDAFGRARANSDQLNALEAFINQAAKDNGK